MSDTRALANFVKMAHLRNCGSNKVTDCGEECGHEKDMAFHQLSALTDRLEHLEAAQPSPAPAPDAEYKVSAEKLAGLVRALLENSGTNHTIAPLMRDELRRLAALVIGGEK